MWRRGAPLEPERGQAIRLMNLHKAKGLEASVVVLANPWAEPRRVTRSVVERGAGGRATGWLLLGVPGRRGQFDELARPFEWSEKEAEAKAFDEAEGVRLLYVAASRAADEILITRPLGSREKRSPWKVFHGWLDAHGSHLELDAEEPKGRQRLEVGVDEMAKRSEAAEDRRKHSGEPDYSFDTVTALVGRDACHSCDRWQSGEVSVPDPDWLGGGCRSCDRGLRAPCRKA